MRFAVGQCSLGAVLVAATDKGLRHSARDDPMPWCAIFGPLPQTQLIVVTQTLST
jgi:hypothetical protein